MRLRAFAPGVALAFALAGCGARPVAKTDAHIQPEERSTASIPQPVRSAPLPPPPEARETEIRYSVVVAGQPVREVLLAMARETRINFDIHPGIEGTINLNAIDQTLRQILTRIAKQVDLRWESDGQTVSVMPDTPYLRTYRVDYVNMARDVTGSVGVQSQVVAPIGAGGAGAGGGTSGSSQNSSLLRVDNIARNRFWETLEKNLKDLLRETDKQLPEGSSETIVQSRRQAQTTRTTPATRTSSANSGGRATSSNSSTSASSPSIEADAQSQDVVESRLTFREAASVIVNAESGTVTIRATSRQQEKVSEFIASVIGSARRQVLIEATVVEVSLSDKYQSGVDWSALGLNGLGYSFRQNLLVGSDLSGAASPFFSIQYNNPNAAVGGALSSTIKLLDTFGNTRVLSSPRIMAINNQTAVLKVVDNLVYFSVTVTPAQFSAGVLVSPAIVSTAPNLVPVGFVMNVTPQISENDMVVLNIRPTITSRIAEVTDPNPNLSSAIPNRVPVIRSREFESVLRIASGQTAIIGGLMEDSFEGNRSGLPILSRIPVFGDAVSLRGDTSSKRELVVFLRPIVIRNASIEGDLAAYRRFLPNQEFFSDTRAPFPCVERTLERMERGSWDPDCRIAPNPVVPDAARGEGRP